TILGFGHDATTAASMRDALALAEAAEPDLVLLDVARCGEMDGAKAADALRRRWRVPVVVVTEQLDDAALGRIGATEPYDVVPKPVAERDLRITLALAMCRHDAARVARDMEDRFFAVSVDMLCFLDFNGYFKRLNPAWERTLGFTIKELTSRPFLEFVHPDDRERTLAQNREVRGGGKALAFENRYLCKDGSYRWLRWNAAPDSDEKVIYSVARDVTASKQAEEERERLVRELQTALAEVKTLQEILPICSYCRKIRDDENYWQTVEGYISTHTNSRFSHSICPSCLVTEVEPQFSEE
ncbi:MAG: domain S-box protein, partial [Gemmatimonadetes bacterium]|nr:domain S-box protein [Gemmatimonadota bacterium]